MDQIPDEAKNFYYYYAAATFFALILIFRGGRPRKGMRLRLGGRSGHRPPPPTLWSDEAGGGTAPSASPGSSGAWNEGTARQVNPASAADASEGTAPNRGGSAAPGAPPAARPQERPLNVVFNYNGHSWDAYEVFGLPAGTALAKVEEAYRRALASTDPTTHNFLQAAYQAVDQQWRLYKQAQ